MTPPRIVHVIDELKVGGAQTHLLTMINAARRLYDSEHLVLSLFGDGPMRARFEEHRVDVEALDLLPSVRARRYPTAARALADVLGARSPTLVEAHLTWSRLLGALATRRTDLRLIGFEQGDLYCDALPFRLANFTAHRAFERIVVCSEWLRGWVHRTHGVPTSALTVMHNCVDTRVYVPERNSALADELGLADDAFVYAAIGTLGRGVNKRVDVLIEAMAVARAGGSESTLLIVGDGEQRASLEAQSRRRGLGDAVRFLGTRGDIPQLLSRADALVHAAETEPFGIVALEAMACGTPPIVPESGGIREAVDPGLTGWTYGALDPRELAALMLRVERQRGELSAMGRRARQAVCERFGSEVYVRRLFDLYGLS